MVKSKTNPIRLGIESPQLRDIRTTRVLTDNELEKLGIAHPGMSDHALLNNFRDIRNKLLRISDYNNFACLVSSLAGDFETSLLTLNLAAVFAFDRSRSAVVVDCDSQSNLIDSLTSNDSQPGLVDYIESESNDLSLLLHESGLPRVRLIPSGITTKTRTESLESTQMRDIILELKNRYPDRYIFINAPSMKMSSEVQILSNISDMVLFQVVASTINENQVSEVVDVIGQEKIAGIIFREG